MPRMHRRGCGARSTETSGSPCTAMPRADDCVCRHGSSWCTSLGPKPEAGASDGSSRKLPGAAACRGALTACSARDTSRTRVRSQAPWVRGRDDMSDSLPGPCRRYRGAPRLSHRDSSCIRGALRAIHCARRGTWRTRYVRGVRSLPRSRDTPHTLERSWARVTLRGKTHKPYAPFVRRPLASCGTRRSKSCSSAAYCESSLA